MQTPRRVLYRHVARCEHAIEAVRVPLGHHHAGCTVCSLHVKRHEPSFLAHTIRRRTVVALGRLAHHCAAAVLICHVLSPGAAPTLHSVDHVLSVRYVAGIHRIAIEHHLRVRLLHHGICRLLLLLLHIHLHHVRGVEASLVLLRILELVHGADR